MDLGKPLAVPSRIAGTGSCLSLVHRLLAETRHQTCSRVDCSHAGCGEGSGALRSATETGSGDHRLEVRAWRHPARVAAVSNARHQPGTNSVSDEPATTIALLGAIESLLSAVVADGLSGDRHDSNTELVAQGVANIVCPLFGGLPATGAIARTSANANNGGRNSNCRNRP
jgi:hypothetical protein